MSRRTPFGRRRSDWIIPILLLSLVLVAIGWAVYNRVQAKDAETISNAYKDQATVLERQLKTVDKKTKPK